MSQNKLSEGLDSSEAIRFRVTRLSATAPEGVPIVWEGRAFNSGPLTIELDESAEADSRGVLDYGRRRAEAEFHVRVGFPEFADMLEGAGIDAELTRPVRAVLRSSGNILEDHGFALSGECRLQPHGLFPPRDTSAFVLPGY